MKVKRQIDRGKLEQAIAEVEGGPTPPKNRSQLWAAVAKVLGEPPGSVMGRVKDYGIEVKTPLRKKGGYEKKPKDPTPDVVSDEVTDAVSDVVTDEVSPPPRTKFQAQIDISPFHTRGIKVKTLADLLTSPLKDDETNRTIMGAISEVRRQNNLPALSLEQFKELKKEPGGDITDGD